MRNDTSISTARREFIKFVAASPYVAALGGVTAFFEKTGFAQTLAQAAAQAGEVISKPADAFDVFDFEEAAHRKVQQAHWAYMASGVDDDATLRANREGFKHIELRPRRLHDATKVDTHVDFFGKTYNSPIFLCPTGGEKSFFPEGELAVARSAKAHGTLQILSTATSTPVEDVCKERGEPVWQQLYAPTSWDACVKILKRVEAAGVPVILLTVDNTTGRNSETYLRTRGKDLHVCLNCHETPEGPTVHERPMYDGIDMTGVKTTNPTMDWDYLDKLRATWKRKLFVKGIDTREDARLCVDHGLDGILLSNHGGRSTETSRATIEALPEVVAEVNGRIPVYVDGGFRRGTDVFKALALGAKGVGIGRPFLWGLGAFGQAGVDRVIEIMQGELKLAMGNCGTRTVADITKDHVTAWRS